MAAVTKTTPNAGLATQTPCMGHFSHHYPVGEDIPPLTPCYFAPNGTIKRSTGAANAADNSGEVDGWCLEDAKVGQAQSVALVWDVTVSYGVGMTPGANLFLSGSVAGGLDTAATADGQERPVAVVEPDGRRIRLRRTR